MVKRLKRSTATARLNKAKGWIEHDVTAVWPNGEWQRERQMCPRQSLGAAKTWARERLNELLDLGPPSTRQARAKSITWSDLWTEFKRLHFTSGPRGELKASQRITLESHWDNHIQPTWGKRALDETTPKLIVEWIAALQQPYKRKTREGQTRSPKTVNNVLTTFNTMLNRAEDWDLAPRGLPRAKLFRLAKPEIEFYSARDFAYLLECAGRVGDDAVLAVLLGARAGLRAGEILALRLSDLHATKNELLVQRSIWYGHLGTPKGGRSRRVPVSEDIARRMRERRGTHALAQKDGKPLTIRRLRALLQAVEREASARPATGKIHKLRHTYASHLVMAGVPIAIVQELLGHADIATTMRYAHLAPNAKSDAVLALDGDGWETIQRQRKEAIQLERETGFEPGKVLPAKSSSRK